MLLIWLTVKYYETNNYEFLMVVYFLEVSIWNAHSLQTKCFNSIFISTFLGVNVSWTIKWKALKALHIFSKQCNASIWPSVGHFNRISKKMIDQVNTLKITENKIINAFIDEINILDLPARDFILDSRQNYIMVYPQDTTMTKNI